ncbi:hypothetical protein RJT34_27262 [Clitoria ternatea]|uniref:DUF6821 domain-containing protein n=1 Tax=Clitoria ternatea TaxID=43366 RepID=A0AAN9FGC5_CLITE
MEGKTDDWELLHHDDDDSSVFVGPPLDSLKPDHFSLNPNLISSSSSSSNSSSEVDRNFDDSYVANQLFPDPNPSPQPHPWNNATDSDSDTTGTIHLPEGEAEVDAEAQVVAFDSKAEEPVVVVEDEEEERGVIEGGEKEEEGRRTVWWKVPFEVLKYWVNPLPLPLPLWSLSVAAAAAFLGLFFLGRRLYKIKRKTQTFNLNLALDDKKVSQLMGRVARLNEAFSVVKRVPIVRPSLPASSITLRPVMSMR